MLCISRHMTDFCFCNAGSICTSYWQCFDKLNFLPQLLCIYFNVLSKHAHFSIKSLRRRVHDILLYQGLGSESGKTGNKCLTTVILHLSQYWLEGTEYKFTVQLRMCCMQSVVCSHETTNDSMSSRGNCYK